ncbi:class III lanthionine synthetase LanKC [Corallococcus exercitus]|uniref:class III lanthionine synthetase LanKC n=1 Tax=Corallococcus exercitus TaxID=2316736 RepID=UPI0035D3EBD1
MGSPAAFDLSVPGDALLRVVRAVLPPTWPIRQDDLWYLSEPPGVRLPRQGWVVELSATPSNCEAILHRTATLCGELGVALQFPLDRQVVTRVTGQAWPRESGGRVISLYPVDDARFHQVLERLHTALREFDGPYILSGKRFRDSKVVHYRYGGFPGPGVSVLRVTGERQPMLEAPDGTLVPDERAPLWSPPPWLSDPFPDKAVPDEESDGISLNKGRYLIRSVMRSAVSGGVYVGLDRETEAAVTIKEARPHAGLDADGLDAVERLKRQYRLLQELQDTGFTPAPLDLFWEWEHLFLVEERIRGLSLEEYAAASNPLVRGQGPRARQEAFAAKFRKIASNLATGLDEMHARGFVLGPVTVEDVVVTDLDADWVRVWNLDTAREAGGGRAPADDLHVLGTLLADTLWPRSGALTRLDPSRAQPFLALGADGIGLGDALEHTILRCLDPDPAQRPTAAEVLQVLGQRAGAGLAGAQPRPPVEPQPTQPDALQGTLQAAITALRASADPRPPDRLLPADSPILAAHPLSLAYGAAGIGYALARLTGSAPGAITVRMLSEPAAPDRYPPGLYVGSAGVAWALWEMGLGEVALQTLRSARNHPLLRDAADVFHGAAGYGLACLRFHGLTGSQEWLDDAVSVGEQLLRTRIEKGAGVYWPDRDGAVGLGYAKGAAGIGLFLLYLSLATGDSRFLKTGTAALDHDLTHLWDEPGTHLAMMRRPAGAGGAPESCPDWYEGTAGVGTALVRFWHVTRDERYRGLLERIAPDAARTYAATPGLFHGMAGLGNFLLDLYRFTGQSSYLQQARHAGQLTALFGVKQGAGVAFPGKDVTRLTLDFGTGTAGVALFLHRLAHADERRDNFNLLPDTLLAGQPGA